MSDYRHLDLGLHQTGERISRVNVSFPYLFSPVHRQRFPSLQGKFIMGGGEQPLAHFFLGGDPLLSNGTTLPASPFTWEGLHMEWDDLQFFLFVLKVI